MIQNSPMITDIIENHNDRMQNLKKFIPFFRLQDSAMNYYKEGKYAFLDLGYLTMALLRYFIEENNFNDRQVSYAEVISFMTQALQRDFDLFLSEEEYKDLIGYMFDKIKNDGKPFVMDYFDPADKKRKTARMKLIDSKLSNGTVLYTITADAIEFYLETKEVKEESRISIEQLLLEKMITTKNFRGGIEVIRRINGEVNRLRLRKQEVLQILGNNVFEGVKALEEFNKTGIQWFNEEQKAFLRNKQLIDQAYAKTEQLANTEQDPVNRENSYREIYELEVEINKAIDNHGRLLSDCTELQKRADEIISKYKFSRLRNAFDFSGYLEKAKEKNNTEFLSSLMMPLLKPKINKSFYIGSIDELLLGQTESEEKGQLIGEQLEENYRYDDEIEEERLESNYQSIVKTLLDTLLSNESFDLKQFNAILEVKYFDVIFKNSDYYSFLVQLCQKKEYDLSKLEEHQDTFFEGILAKFLLEPKHARYKKLKFRLELSGEESLTSEGMLKEEDLLTHNVLLKEHTGSFTTSNIRFIRI
ncbi:hypothetical protein [Clostridium sp. Marseille-P299]|uniref:hypothetical protein n=1 Tax=Clostridium sp. Marseille-P299 TaxID=1805477 RepID=UPI000835D051|nr:hypothetical protein [Clostridium sp. Marseille-P299]